MDNKNIIFKHTLKEYNKRYRHHKNLLKFTKKEVEEFDRQANTIGEQYVLRNNKWWFIDDTYYQVPKALHHYWFRNLNAGAQTAICLLGAGVIATGASLPFILKLGQTVEPTITITGADFDKTASHIELNKESTIKLKQQGEKTITGIEYVKVADKKLKEDQYSYDEMTKVVTIKAEAMTSTKIVIKVETEQEVTITLDKHSATMKVGEKLQLNATVTGTTKTVFWGVGGESLNACKVDQKGLVTAKQAGNCVIKAGVAGKEDACAITVEEDTTRSVSLTSGPDGAGTLIGAGTYEIGTEVTIKATPSTSNYKFIGWFSDSKLISKESTYKFIIEKNVSLYALFDNEVASNMYVSGCHNIEITDTETEYDLTAKAEDGTVLSEVTYTGDSSIFTITENKFKINSNVKPGSYVIVAYKEGYNYGLFEIEIATFDENKISFEKDEDNNIKVGAPNYERSSNDPYALYIPSRYYYEGDNSFLPVTSVVYGGFAEQEIYYVYIPNSIVKLNNYAFYDCINLKSVVFAENSILSSIGDSCFQSTSIKSINIPESVTYIGPSAFYGCSDLDLVTANNSYVANLTEVDYNTATYLYFYPSKVRILNAIKLEDTSFITTDYFDSKETEEEYKVYDRILYQCEIIEGDKVNINLYNFAAYSIKGDYTVPTEIDGMFVEFGEKGKKYKVVAIGNGDGEAGLNDCNASSINIPEGIEKIDYRGVAYCDNLETLTISKTVTYINTEIFIGCGNLKTVTIDEDNPNYDSRHNCNAIITKTKVGDVEANTLINGNGNSTIPQTVETIGQAAFYGQENFTESAYKIAEGVRTICSSAFDGTNLKIVDLPTTIETLDDSSFGYCDELETINYAGTILQWKKVNRSQYWHNGSSKLTKVICSDGECGLDDK